MIPTSTHGISLWITAPTELTDENHYNHITSSCAIYICCQQQPTMPGSPPTGNTPTQLITETKTRTSLLELLLLKSVDLRLSEAVRGRRMKIELEDECSYEIFTFIYHPFVCLLAAAVNLLVTSGTFKLGQAGGDKKKNPDWALEFYLCVLCFVVTR